MNAEGYGSVLEYEREAEERFYRAVPETQSPAPSWFSRIDPFKPEMTLWKGRPTRWIDGQWRSDGTGWSEHTKVTHAERFKTYDDKTLD